MKALMTAIVAVLIGTGAARATNEVAELVAPEARTGIARLFADADTYYMGADIGAAFKADDYRGPSMIRNVAKAPFVALWQAGKSIARIPGATWENGKHDKGEALLQVIAVLAAVGNETEWFGLEGSDDPPKGRSEQYNQAGLPLEQGTGGSDLRVHVTRDQASVATSSSKDVEITATFGSSGSSELQVSVRDAGGFEEGE